MPDEWYFSFPGFTGVKAGNSRVSGKYFFHSPVIGPSFPDQASSFPILITSSTRRSKSSCRLR